MRNINELTKELAKAGKVEKLIILVEIMKLCYEGRNRDIFTYFDMFLFAIKEYLSFDPKPDEAIRNNITAAFSYAFDFIRCSNDFAGFDKYYPAFFQVEEYITDEVGLAQIYQAFGYFHWIKQEMEKSIEYLTKSLELINRSGKIDEIPGRYTNLGYLYEFRGDFDRAEMYYREGLSFAKKHNSTESMKLAYAAIGRINIALSNLKKAEHYLKEALALYDKDSQESDKIAVIANLALLYYQTAEYKEALELCLGVKTEELKNRDPRLYYSILDYIALCYIELKEYEKAKTFLFDGLEFAEKIGAKDQIVGSYVLLGRALEGSGEIDKALDCYEKAYRDNKEYYRYGQTIHSSIANIYRKKGKLKKAISHFKKAGYIYKKQKLYERLAKVYRVIALCYEELGDFSKALEAWKECWKQNQKHKEELAKKEEERQKEELIDCGPAKQIIFKETNTFISRELSQKIGAAIIGNSPVILAVIEQALLAAKNDSVSILLQGESGVGKELIARLIHYAGNRASYPFIDVNSASCIPGLAESALFGHNKGAFTGAASSHYGYFQAADKGTLFFDEIGDMPMEIQSKLLRVLETKSFKPVGDNNPVRVDFRLISATHHDLSDRIADNLFRFDLLNRINTIEILIPPLRERKEDIPLLIDYYANMISLRVEKKRPNFSNTALNILCDYDYPGNVRELYNLMERIILFAKSNLISADDIHLNKESEITQTFADKPQTLNLAENEAVLIKRALKEANNVKSDAARLLGISPYALLRRLKKGDIDINE